MKIFLQFLIVLMLVAVVHPSSGQIINQALNKRLEALKGQSDKERVFIISDRDLYSPGENVWFTGLVYDILSPSLSTLSSSMDVRIYNSDEVEVLAKNFPLVNGIATGAMLLPADMPDDIYYLKGETSLSGGPGLYFKKIIVNQKSVAPFVIETSVPDQIFKPGEEIPVTLTFKDFYNEPISNVNYQIVFLDGEKILSEIPGKTKKEQNTVLKFTVPKSLTTGLLNYRITASQKNREAILTGQLRTISDKIFVEFTPESGKLVDNIQTKVRFYIYDAIGQPVKVSGNLIARDVKLQSVTSNSHGLGVFSLTPSAGTEYTLQLDLAGTGVLEFPLPAVQAKGMALQLSRSSENTVSGLVKSNFPTETSTILIAESNGVIVHLSEQKISGEYPVLIDISKVPEAMIHFILTSANAEILAEQLVFTGNINAVEQLTPVSSQRMVRGKMLYEMAEPAGAMVMSAVNQPWISGNVFNQQPWLLAFPYDLVTQSMFQSENFLSGNFDDQLRQEYLACYTPSLFSWDKVLNSQTGQVIYEDSKLVATNKALLDKIKIHGFEIRTNDVVQHTNMNASSYFIMSNTKYLTALHEQKIERVPAYQKMLQSGTPLLDVIQTIKPYKLEGSNIVFVGTSNSFSYQGGALIVIDGVNRGTDISILRNISPFEVDKINVSTNPVDIQRYTGLNSVGLIEIWLKKAEVASTSKTKTDDGEFTPVNHEESKNPEPDFRSTLHWYSGTSNQNERWQQKYFNSDLLSSVIVRFYMIPSNGIPVIFQDYYKVDPK